MTLASYRIASITALHARWSQTDDEWLSASEREQLDRHRHLGRRRAWLAGRWLCKQLIQQEITSAQAPAMLFSAIEIQSLDVLQRSARPRVFIEGRMQPMDISISHSHDWIGVAISTSPGYLVGIDLVPQTLKAVRNLDIWLTEPERQWLDESPDRCELPVIWSIKESVYKATNRGEPFQPQQMEVCRTASGQYECCCKSLVAETVDSITVATHVDHIVTITTHPGHSLTRAS
jgi:phosphopantetheinyl transferase